MSANRKHWNVKASWRTPRGESFFAEGHITTNPGRSVAYALAKFADSIGKSPRDFDHWEVQSPIGRFS